MTKAKKIILAIGAGLAAFFEGFILIFFFDKEKRKLKEFNKTLEDINKTQAASIKAAQTFQEEQRKSEEIKNKIYTEFGSSSSVNAALELMHNNEKRSRDRKNS